MIKNLLIALVAVTSFCIAYAHEYVPMIREDRVWQYKGQIFSSDIGLVYHDLKFDGSSVTVNGKIYHTFTYVKSKYYAYDIETHTNVFHHEVDYDGNGLKYFVREESGKVYVLSYINNYVYNTRSNLSEGLEDIDYSELLLYDFTKEDGEVLDDEFWLIRSGSVSNESIKLLEGEPSILSIDGQDCRYVGIEEIGYDNERKELRPTLENNTTYLAYAWIEGIGTLGNGCLADYECGFIAGSFSNIDSLGQFSSLSSVYKTDGTVIYGQQPAGAGMVEVGNLKLWRAEGAIRAAGDGYLTVTICSVDGVKYAEAAGDSDVSVDTSSLARGIYIVTAEANSEHRTIKIRI